MGAVCPHWLFFNRRLNSREGNVYMDRKKIVIALGGNALGNTLPEQMAAAKHTSQSIVDLIESGYQVIVTHGNGPQVGMINQAMYALEREDPEQPNTPISVCVAMSQAYIGYDLQNAIREELRNRSITDVPVSTVVTQVRVDRDDPAFDNPTKPIGKFMSREVALEQARRFGHIVKEDAGRGYRRVVASPMPKEIVEIGAIRALVDCGELVICCGGGGIPVCQNGNHLSGASAVIDKDLVSALLAEELDADSLVILTAVEKVAVNFGKPEQRDLDRITVDEARRLMAEGHFAPGSMLPKVEAAVRFASSKPGREALITLLDKARDGLEGRTGTRIRQ